MTLLEAALYYASLGHPVFPLAAGSKKPLKGSNGLSDATTDADQIRSWWTEHPDANIGVRTDHVFVPDPDVKDGRKGLDHWRGLLAENGEEPDDSLGSAIATTPSGGRHLWFRRPADYEGGCRSGDGKNPWLPDVDLKTGPGGYVVAAPSSTRDGAYEWIAGAVGELPLPPQWLVAASRKGKRDNTGRGRGEGTEPLPTNSHPERTPEETLTLVRRCLDELGADYYDPRDRWVEVGAAVHDAAGGSEDGHAAWEGWSKQSTKFDAADCQRVWSSFTVGGGLTIASLIAWAGLKLGGGNGEAGDDTEDDGGAAIGPGGLALTPVNVHRTKTKFNALFAVRFNGNDAGEMPISTSPTGRRQAAAELAKLCGADRDEVLTWLNRYRLTTKYLERWREKLARVNDEGEHYVEVIAANYIKALDIAYVTPDDQWFLETDGRYVFPTRYLRKTPRRVLYELGKGTADGISIVNGLRPAWEARVHELVPRESDADRLGPRSRAAGAFKSMVRRRLLLPSEVFPKDVGGTVSTTPCGPLHLCAAKLVTLRSAAAGIRLRLEDELEREPTRDEMIEAIRASESTEAHELRFDLEEGTWRRPWRCAAALYARVHIDRHGRPGIRIGFHHTLFAGRDGRNGPETDAGTSNRALRRIMARYQLLDESEEFAGARSAGRSGVRLVVASADFTTWLIKLALASMPGSHDLIPSYRPLDEIEDDDA